MTAWELPTSLTVHGKTYAIRTDYRVVLDVFRIMDDPDLFEPDASDDEKNYVLCSTVLEVMFEDFKSLPVDDWGEAMQAVMDFIDCGVPKDAKRSPKTMDWDQDAGIMIPAINKALGTEIRALDYLHWYTFVGGYMEIGRGVFSQVVMIRNKKARGKMLEKDEKEWYAQNRHLVDFKKKVSEEQQREIDNISKWL